MDIFDSRFYSLNKNLLSFIGQWPYQTVKKQRMLRIVIHTIIVTMLTAELISLTETLMKHDWDFAIETMPPISVALVSIVKSSNGMINEDKMLRLFEAMKNNWSDIDKDEEMKILEKYSERGRRITVFYSIWMFVSAFLYSLIPLMPRLADKFMPLDNGTRPREYLFQTQYYVDPEEYFFPILAHTYMTMVGTMTTIVAVDTIYATYIEHVCGLFAIVGYRLENLTKDFASDLPVNISKDDDRFYHELVHCISKHFQAIEFADRIESAYTISWLLQIAISVVTLSITGVEVLIKFGHYEEMTRLLQFILAQLSHIFFNSLPGQKLVDETTKFRESVYCTKWYLLSLRARRLLVVVMIRSLRPQKITAGKIYDMSIENFGKLVQTSVSYFTVFASYR